MFGSRTSPGATPYRRKLLALLLCMGIFCCGGIAGSAGTVFWLRSHGGFRPSVGGQHDPLLASKGREMFLQRLDQLFKLEPRQKERITALVDSARLRLAPTVIGELKAFSAALERELTPEQTALWRTEVDRFRQKHFPGGADLLPSSAVPVPLLPPVAPARP